MHVDVVGVDLRLWWFMGTGDGTRRRAICDWDGRLGGMQGGGRGLCNWMDGQVCSNCAGWQSESAYRSGNGFNGCPSSAQDPSSPATQSPVCKRTQTPLTSPLPLTKPLPSLPALFHALHTVNTQKHPQPSGNIKFSPVTSPAYITTDSARLERGFCGPSLAHARKLQMWPEAEASAEGLGWAGVYEDFVTRYWSQW